MQPLNSAPEICYVEWTWYDLNDKAYSWYRTNMADKLAYLILKC